MKKTLVLLALFVAGLVASFAIASPGAVLHRSTTGSTLTGETGTTGKVTICHRTSSPTRPYVLITVSPHALPAHAGHGDVNPTNGTCPTTGPTGATGASGPTGATGPAGPSGSDVHGKSGQSHGKSGLHGQSGQTHGKSGLHGKSGVSHGKSGLHGKSGQTHGKSSSHKNG